MAKFEQQFTKLVTPATVYTGEIGFVVSVDPDVDWIGTTTMPTLGETYSSSPIQPKPYADKLDYAGAAFGTYVCTKIDGGAGRWQFYYSKAKTDAEMRAPFNSETKFLPRGWDAILKFLNVIADYGAPRSGATMNGSSSGFYIAPEYYAQAGFVPAGSYMTKVKRFDYFGPRKFKIRKRRSPVPSSINLMLPGREAISFPSCLHPKISVQRLVTSTQQLLGGVGNGLFGSIPGQVFPATEYDDWVRHVEAHDQQQTGTGAYLATKWVIYPPNEPEITVR